MYLEFFNHLFMCALQDESLQDLTVSTLLRIMLAILISERDDGG